MLVVAAAAAFSNIYWEQQQQQQKKHEDQIYIFCQKEISFSHILKYANNRKHTKCLVSLLLLSAVFLVSAFSNFVIPVKLVAVVIMVSDVQCTLTTVILLTISDKFCMKHLNKTGHISQLMKLLILKMKFLQYSELIVLFIVY